MHIMHYHVKPNYARGAIAAFYNPYHSAPMNLAQIRLAQGLTQADLGEMIGKDQATVQRAEKEHPSAKLSTYKDCAEALGVTLADIFSDDRTLVEIEILRTYRRAAPHVQEKMGELLGLIAGAQEEHGETGRAD